MKFFGCNKSKITNDETGENVPHLEIIEVVLVRCNTFISNESFGQLLDISPKNFIFSKPLDSKFSYIAVWFTDQNSEPLDIEDRINITLVIN